MEAKIKAAFAIVVSGVALLGTLAGIAGLTFDVQPIIDMITKWQGMLVMGCAAIATWLQSLPAQVEVLKTPKE